VLKNAFLDTTLRNADRDAHSRSNSTQITAVTTVRRFATSERRPTSKGQARNPAEHTKPGRHPAMRRRQRHRTCAGGDDGEAAVETTATSNLCTDAPDGAPPLGERKDALDTVALRRCRAQVASVTAAAAAAS
jgi:hypothetical protein